MGYHSSPDVLTRFLVISDTHHVEPDEFRQAFHPLPKVDVLLHCGDLTQCGGISSYKKALRILGGIDAELKLVIAGNHDLELDGDYWRSHLIEDEDLPEEHDHAVGFWKGSQAEAAGVTYLEEGLHTFKLSNGSQFTLYASPYQPEFNDMAFNYKHEQDRFNDHSARHPVPDFPNVDIMMTHGPPKGVLDECKNGSVGCPHILRAAQRAHPRMHCLGHVHEGYGAGTVEWTPVPRVEKQALVENTENAVTAKGNGEFGTTTLVINAAIMTAEHRPVNKPMFADIPLKKEAPPI